MGRFIGRKAKSVDIRVPNDQKIKGIITEIKRSDLYPDSLSIKIECPEHTGWSDDGQRQFVKFAYFSFPMNWSAKNKSGRFYEALMGKSPTGEVDWEELLLNREIAIMFKDDVDQVTGESKGQRISWIGNMDGGPKSSEKSAKPSSNTPKKDELELNEEAPF